MELKEFQVKALAQVKNYLELVAKERKAGNLKHASQDAWESLGLKNYQPRQNGLGQDLPNFCLKIPTGGGKTFLAVKALDIINTVFKQKQTGLILWVVPTTQIYNQTIKNLRDHGHPYRQHLDLASGGRTLILEKTSHFTPEDVSENLVVLMLMLPSASRQSKETLKVFRDNGGFTQFFPPEDALEKHQELLQMVPNLDFFGDENNFWGKQIKTSLGNVLRLLSPVVILDEGHKAYSLTAQDTLYGLNPSLILELSATPTPASNILVDIRGLELLHEGMIKLDLHVSDKNDPDWHKTMLAAIDKRNLLEKRAREYEANTDKYIRPICLIQVERTGKDQIGGGKIHSEEVKDYLVKTVGILPEEIAIKTSEKDELKEVDDIGGLMSRDCKIRYIITKQALQEGWDCPFAYVLAILTNPSSKNALTQLVGRILRQPEAIKTKIPELDESYVFTFQQRAVNLLASIRNGFGHEGLGDLTGQIVSEDTSQLDTLIPKERVLEVREKFKDSVKNIILPVFAIKRDDLWQAVSYEIDICPNIDWPELNIRPLFNLNLSNENVGEVEVAVGLSENKSDLISSKKEAKIKDGSFELNSVFLARQILDIVPNAWIAYFLADKLIQELLVKYNPKILKSNLRFILDEFRKLIATEKNNLAKEYFLSLISTGKLRFYIVGKELGYKLPQKIKILPEQKSISQFPLQKSLFDFVGDDDLDEEEKKVALYLDGQTNLFFWFRNVSRNDYALQGWQKNKVYPDFIFTKSSSGKQPISNVFVVETKGAHLIGNEDTKYKESLLGLCDHLAKERKFEELELVKDKAPISYKMINLDEWQNEFNKMLN